MWITLPIGQIPVTHCSIQGRGSPRSKKEIAPICIGVAEIFTPELTSRFCTPLKLSYCLDPTFIPGAEDKTRKFSSWFQATAQTEIFVSRVPGCSQDLCQVYKWRRKNNFLRHQTCSVPANSCLIVFQGKLGGCQLIVTAGSPSAHWQSRFGVKIPLLCLQSQHTALRQQNTMKSLLIFHVHGFSELFWAVPVSSGAHTGKPQN